ncbi:MAG: rod shape-determining protein MreD [Pseudomonadota bacterium]|nr:rod shape-determining protein MreD [Pseudomonadota bacterium]
MRYTESSLRIWFTVLLTLVFAMMLTILPIPHIIVWVRPLWVPAVVFYWALAIPERFGIGKAWVVGIFLDVLMGTLLGENAFALATSVFFLAKFHIRIRLFPSWQQAMIVLMLSFCYLSLIFWMQGLIGQPPLSWQFWTPALSTALLWPWMYIMLRDYRRHSIH